MSKATSKRKGKAQYRGYCSQLDVIRQSTTVRTFDKQTWSNHWDGHFMCLTQNEDETIRSEVEELSKIYKNIQTVANKDLVIARRSHPDQALKFLVEPYVIGRRK
ncbi:hypothetical protein A5819_003535 [Enterococcus sp. 7E2_DIV0204]|uniref:hypothetical protein n=1 Tax=unclassified Enterococcus TaxID=2608891 RepID=UPI000A34A19D|nr:MULTISPECIES: hypothetical protein [unclassified Enterococcus]OTN83985.1 hypothetical protein A5819_003535 [Enterococcus sp. 7E2_DIV0204]OTP47232.1 hypothetical protein A5884_003607 [Enterococcus sp. 7D2_DIV0200]